MRWDSGGSGGYHAYFLQFPEQHFSVACFCNRGGINRAKRVHAVADLYLDVALKSKDGVLSTRLTPQELQALTGTYRDPKRGDVWRVSALSGKLWAELDGSILELRALSPTEFEPAEYPLDIHLRFESARAGLAHKLIVTTQFQQPVTAEAIQEAKPGAAELATCAGNHWSDELRVTYGLTVNNGKLRMNELIGADGIVQRARFLLPNYGRLLPTSSISKAL